MRLGVRRRNRQTAAISEAACAEAAFDTITAAISLADIAADVAVAVEFAHAGRMGFFAVSCAIFAAAQSCYAFLFVLTFGAHLSNKHKSVVFFIALPFSQLVPIFTLLEAQTSLFAGCLTRIGLRPTNNMLDAAPNGSDSLWTLLHRKFHSHAGFLVEALVEAIPQCALQIAAVVSAGEFTPLALLSILLSLSVICSSNAALRTRSHPGANPPRRRSKGSVPESRIR